MADFAESVFSTLDYFTQQFIYVCWVPAFAAFVTLCVSSDKDLQFARMAKLSSIATPCLLVFHVSYFLTNPNETFLSFVLNFLLVFPLVIYNTNHFLWLVYGDDAISVDVKHFHSFRLVIEAGIKNTLLRTLAFSVSYIIVAFITLAGGQFISVFTALLVVRKQLTVSTPLLVSFIITTLYSQLLGYMAADKKKEIKRVLAQECSKEISAEEATAEFADEKVARQASVAA